jgi:hypothetical protein
MQVKLLLLLLLLLFPSYYVGQSNSAVFKCVEITDQFASHETCIIDNGVI